jgi:hypothetical protein
VIVAVQLEGLKERIDFYSVAIVDELGRIVAAFFR